MKTIRYEKRNNQRLLFDSNELPPGKNPFVHTCRPQIENPGIVQIRSFKVHRALEKIVVVGVVIGRAALRRKALSSCNFPSLESRMPYSNACMNADREKLAIAKKTFSKQSWFDCSRFSLEWIVRRFSGNCRGRGGGKYQLAKGNLGRLARTKLFRFDFEAK